MLRILRLTRISAVRARAKAFVTLKAVIVTAPDELRAHLSGVYKQHLLAACIDLATPETACTPGDAVVMALKSLAQRCLHLDAETKALDTQIHALSAHACPTLRQVYGVGPDTAATLLVALGDNPYRIATESASSGKTVRHRLNRGGNRDANRALHVICVVRLRRHQPTRSAGSGPPREVRSAGNRAGGRGWCLASRRPGRPPRPTAAWCHGRTAGRNSYGRVYSPRRCATPLSAIRLWACEGAWAEPIPSVSTWTPLRGVPRSS